MDPCIDGILTVKGISVIVPEPPIKRRTTANMHDNVSTHHANTTFTTASVSLNHWFEVS